MSNTVMEYLVRLFREMKKKKIIKAWALGGGIAAKYYTNPPFTRDVDFFVIVEDQSLSFMGPIYAFMMENGARFEGHLFKYKGAIVDIIPAMNGLVREAIENAITVKYEGAMVKIVDPNYLAAIALQVGRKKDIDRVERLLDDGKLTKYFLAIAGRYSLPLNKLQSTLLL